jgi:hypothetical protein
VQAGAEATAVAIVSWQGDRQVRIQVGLRHRRQWRIRQLAFEEADAPVERWKAAGYATGTLAGEVSGVKQLPTKEPVLAAEPAARPPPAPTPRPRAPKKPAVAERPPPLPERQGALWFDIGGLVGSGLESESQDETVYKKGLFGRLAYAPFANWPFVYASVGYAWVDEDAEGVGANWTSMALGGGQAFLGIDCSWCLDSRLSLLVQRLQAEAVQEDPPSDDRGQRWILGAQAGADLSYVHMGIFGPFVGGELSLLFGDTDIRNKGSVHSTESRWHYSAILGFRLRPR